MNKVFGIEVTRRSSSTRLAAVTEHLDLDWVPGTGPYGEMPDDGFLPFYGLRPADNEPPHPFLEHVPLPQLRILHQAFQKEVLIDEGGLIPEITIAPDSDGATRSRENNNVWLTAIQKGIWPLMTYVRGTSDSGRAAFRVGNNIDRLRKMQSYVFRHDFQTRHIFLAATLYGELQADLRQIASLSLQQRLKGNYEGLCFSHEEPTEGAGLAYNPQDPLKQLLRKEVTGIHMIDVATDNSSYPICLGQLGISKDPLELGWKLKEIMAANLLPPRVEEFSNDERELLNYSQAVGAIAVAVRNFVVRHVEARNLEPEECQAVCMEAVDGIIRVAMKIRGDAWTEPKPA